MDENIQTRVRACHDCQVHSNMPAAAPLQPWKWPERPWHRIHIDYAGPIQGKMVLVMIDAHSKWLEAIPVASANATNTIDKLRWVFSTHGLPAEIVSDNGSPFVNEQFKEFTEKNEVNHIRVAPYHPASNGMAERAVQTVKRGLANYTEGTLETRLIRFLLTYRRLPQTTTEKSPAELLMGRQIRTRLDKIYPDPSARVMKKQDEMKANHDRHAKERYFEVGEEVYVSMLGKGWVSGVITAITAPLSYTVRLEDDRVLKRHVDHIRKKWDRAALENVSPLVDGNSELIVNQNPLEDESVVTDRSVAPVANSQDHTLPAVEQGTTSENSEIEDLGTAVRKSSRKTKPPDRLGWD